MKNYENYLQVIGQNESNEVFEVYEVDMNDLDSIEFDGIDFKEDGKEIDLDSIVFDEIEKGLLLKSEGYRGSVNYEGIFVVNGVVFWVDIASEGYGYELEGDFESNVEFIKRQTI